MDNERQTSAQADKHSAAEQHLQDRQGDPLPPEDMQPLLQDARNKADEHRNQLLRVTADLENLRRRNQRDLENAHRYALERFAMELLPVKDSMELGLAAMGAEAQAGPGKDTAQDVMNSQVGEVQKLREGLELTAKMLQTAMEKFGITEINPVGERFNPELHQAMLTQESAEVEPNTILAVYQKGYKLHDRLIRPAMVIVSKAPTTGPAKNGEQA